MPGAIMESKIYLNRMNKVRTGMAKAGFDIFLSALRQIFFT